MWQAPVSFYVFIPGTCLPHQKLHFPASWQQHRALWPDLTNGRWVEWTFAISAPPAWTEAVAVVLFLLWKADQVVIQLWPCRGTEGWAPESLSELVEQRAAWLAEVGASLLHRRETDSHISVHWILVSHWCLLRRERRGRETEQLQKEKRIPKYSDRRVERARW